MRSSPRDTPRIHVLDVYQYRQLPEDGSTHPLASTLSTCGCGEAGVLGKVIPAPITHRRPTRITPSDARWRMCVCVSWLGWILPSLSSSGMTSGMSSGHAVTCISRYRLITPSKWPWRSERPSAERFGTNRTASLNMPLGSRTARQARTGPVLDCLKPVNGKQGCEGTLSFGDETSRYPWRPISAGRL